MKSVKSGKWKIEKPWKIRIPITVIWNRWGIESTFNRKLKFYTLQYSTWNTRYPIKGNPWLLQLIVMREFLALIWRSRILDDREHKSISSISSQFFSCFMSIIAHSAHILNEYHSWLLGKHNKKRKCWKVLKSLNLYEFCSMAERSFIGLPSPNSKSNMRNM